MRHFLPFLLLLANPLASSSADAPAPFNTERNTNGPMTAAEVVARTPLPDGFQMTVFAAEPDVQQPIAMATDPRGRLWVAENYTYSEMQVGYHPELRDRILVFEDTDNDGRFNRRTVFLDGLERLTSVEVGLGGVWALALPQLLFIPDADGDGIPDGPPRVVLDGFEYHRGRHTVANGLRWGPDGWLYGRHGIQSTSHIGPPDAPQSERTAMNVGVWRYHPGRGVTEVVAEGTTNPWGMDWDARGELYFINTVIGHLWHVIPGAHYRRMYGADPTPNIYEVIEQHADHVHWAQGEAWNEVNAGVSDVTSAAGGGHAHTGLLIYQGGQWPEAWNNKLLTLNFHGRRLNVERLERHDSGFVGRHEPDAFFFADPWFRGIDLIAAPDGGVFVCDWSDSGECHDHDGIHRTSGRIYKITHGEPTAAPTDLAALSSAELANLQTRLNDWFARQSRRVLADRHALGESLEEARAALTRLATSHNREVVRLRAFWTLHATGGVETSLLQAALTRGTEHERAWALRLMEDARHDDPEKAAAFDRFVESALPRRAAEDSSSFVRLTLASLLQKLDPSQRAPIASALLSHAGDADDHNLPMMLWYGVEPLAESADERFVELIANARIPRVQRLGARRLAQDYDTAPRQVAALLEAVADSAALATRRAVLDGLAQGFAGRRNAPAPTGWSELEERLARNADEAVLSRLGELGVLFGDSRALERIKAVALDENVDLDRRRAALQSLIDARAAGLRETCEQLLSVRGLAVTAANGLALVDDPSVANRLLSEWRRLSDNERPGVLNVLISRPAWAGTLLEAMDAGRVRPTELGVAQARQIAAHDQPALTARLNAVWGTLREPDEATRHEALERWRSRLKPDALEQADLRAGREVYTMSCGACHRLYGQGGELGPDLTGSGRRNLDYLLEKILFPNAVVPAGYRQTTLNLSDGRVMTGVVRERTAQAVTLAMIGETVTVSRSDVESEETGELSLMPEGLLDALTETQARDLIAYLMSAAPPAPEGE